MRASRGLRVEPNLGCPLELGDGSWVRRHTGDRDLYADHRHLRRRVDDELSPIDGCNDFKRGLSCRYGWRWSGGKRGVWWGRLIWGGLVLGMVDREESQGVI